ncbi:hypothetical protein [Cohnella rhizosphaerae]|uniref:Uncharacterized protein n=1 Tax=Cohnella rhizosphaerae TaxID=1457232 RepID=A0A9X4KQP3_9BACL|nr:hypothetical protein [Cohnella rhizosphaerae]MDG0809374.1 hypothetical protein [Cohnella rhizosphaerae]
MKGLLRSSADALAAYPLLLALHAQAGLAFPTLGWLALAWLSAAIGRALPALLRGKVPASLVHLALFAAASAAAGAADPRLLWLALPLGILSWIARFDWARTVRCAVAVGLHAIVLAAAAPLGIAGGAKPLLLAAGIVWLAAALYFVQAKSLAEAGLHAGLVTRRLAAAGKRYLALWGVVVALVFLPFAGLPIWPQVVRLIRWLVSLMPAGESVPEPTPQPEPSAQPPAFPQQEGGGGAALDLARVCALRRTGAAGDCRRLSAGAAIFAERGLVAAHRGSRQSLVWQTARRPARGGDGSWLYRRARELASRGQTARQAVLAEAAEGKACAPARGLDGDDRGRPGQKSLCRGYRRRDSGRLRAPGIADAVRDAHGDRSVAQAERSARGSCAGDGVPRVAG